LTPRGERGDGDVELVEYGGRGPHGDTHGDEQWAGGHGAIICWTFTATGR